MEDDFGFDVTHGRHLASDRTGCYRTVVEALTRLADEEADDRALRAFAEAMWLRYARAWAMKNRLHPGAPDDTFCLHDLAGKPCDGRGCFPRAPDHMSLWWRDGQPAVFVAQEYTINGEMMREYVRLCDRLGLNVRVTTWPAWHMPGAILMVEITRAGETLYPARAELEPL
jgi:hypothetical protein